MNVLAKFNEISSMILQDIKETKRNGHTHAHTHGRKDGQRENSIPTHKHSLRGYNEQLLRKPAFCINAKKAADQLPSNAA